jgi:putative oxidoreductase
MKIVALIARILLSLVFIVFGLNGFFHFIPGGPPPGLAGEFLNAMIQSHYVLVVAFLQVAGGALLLIGRYVPLGLTLLGPVIVNILLFHIFLFPQGLVIAVIVTILWLLVFAHYRQNFAGLFTQ